MTDCSNKEIVSTEVSKGPSSPKVVNSSLPSLYEDHQLPSSITSILIPTPSLSLPLQTSMVLPSSTSDPRRRQRGQSSAPQRRHQFQSKRPSATTASASASAPVGINACPYPTNTLGTINYLLNLLNPGRVRQQKQFPRVCMIHQIYSILTDHTTVDRTLVSNSLLLNLCTYLKSTKQG